MPLKILSYDELYGWTMDAIVSQVGRKNNCTFCGVFRRQALDRGAAILNVDHIVTGHNADDIAETVLMNSESLISPFIEYKKFTRRRRSIVMRGDIARLGRCTSICTQGEDTIRRSKPFKYAYEKEIVMYVFWLSSLPCWCRPNDCLTDNCTTSSPGMHTSKSLITSPPNASIHRMPIVAMLEPFSRIWKQPDPVQ